MTAKATAKAPRMWIGNLDGRHKGLVIAKSKAAAARVVGCSIKEFSDYWSEPTRVVQVNGVHDFEPDTLYTCPIGALVPTFMKGKCPL